MLKLLFPETIFLAFEDIAVPMVNILERLIPTHMLKILKNKTLKNKSKYGSAMNGLIHIMPFLGIMSMCIEN